MMKREHQRERALEKITAHILHSGLDRTSLRQLAAAAGVSDRMLLYYFKDKAEIMALALDCIALKLAEQLGGALPAETPLPPVSFLLKAAELTRAGPLFPYMRLGLEISAAAARGEAQYAVIANRISQGFLAWIEARLDIADPVERRETAALILILVDGFAVFDVSRSDSISDAAIRSAARCIGS